jgi:hypothetical protein
LIPLYKKLDISKNCKYFLGNKNNKNIFKEIEKTRSKIHDRYIESPKLKCSECPGIITEYYPTCIRCKTTTCFICEQSSQSSKHKCLKSDLDNLKVLNANSTKCPKCLIRITKVEGGCNQMFCTLCNTPFDYSTGEIYKNAFFHNPEYSDYLDNGGKQVVFEESSTQIVKNIISNVLKTYLYPLKDILITLPDDDISSDVYKETCNLLASVGSNYVRLYTCTKEYNDIGKTMDTYRIKLELGMKTFQQFEAEVYTHVYKLQTIITMKYVIEKFIHDILSNYMNISIGKATFDDTYPYIDKLLKDFKYTCKKFNYKI